MFAHFECYFMFVLSKVAYVNFSLSEWWWWWWW